MEYVVYIRCFLVGILASSSLGPIFILTFNRGAIYGFLFGLATGLGAAIADGLYFFLGLMGVLSLLQGSHKFMFWLDTLGGVLLILFGIYYLKKAWNGVEYFVLEGKLGFSLTFAKSFLLTVLNPIVLLFFMLIGVQILPAGVMSLPLRQVVFASLMVAAGSLTILSVVALVASIVGGRISEKKLRLISFVTGVVFICVGLFFLDHIFLGILKGKLTFLPFSNELNI